MSAVLLIEDDAQVRELLARYLAREGLTTIAKATGREGLTALAGGGIDLVVLDIGLPDLDGWAVLRRIRDEWGDAVAVIVLTARSDEPDRLLGLDLGVSISRHVGISATSAVLLNRNLGGYVDLKFDVGNW